MARRGSGGEAGYALTMTFPTIPKVLWYWQKYLKVPVLRNRWEKLCPGATFPEFQEPDVDVWLTPEPAGFFHLIVSPLWIVMVMGMNVRLLVIFTTFVTEAWAGAAAPPASRLTASSVVAASVDSFPLMASSPFASTRP